MMDVSAERHNHRVITKELRDIKAGLVFTQQQIASIGRSVDMIMDTLRNLSLHITGVAQGPLHCPTAEDFEANAAWPGDQVAFLEGDEHGDEEEEEEEDGEDAESEEHDHHEETSEEEHGV